MNWLMLRLFQRGAPRAPVSHIDIESDREIIRVALKRVASARRFTLRVRTASRDVVLTIPARGSLREARAFAERHAAWIAARLGRLPRPVFLAPGSVAPFRGVDHRIEHRPRARGVVWTEDGEGGPMLCVAGAADHAPRRIADFLKRMARRDLEAAVAHHCAALGLPGRGLTLRDTTSRWGSCSSTGALNFSWRLILAPAFVLDYLAAHEVAHLVHMNHSDAFWRVTRKLFPETDRAEVWLKFHGSGLHRFSTGAHPRVDHDS